MMMATCCLFVFGLFRVVDLCSRHMPPCAFTMYVSQRSKVYINYFAPSQRTKSKLVKFMWI